MPYPHPLAVDCSRLASIRRFSSPKDPVPASITTATSGGGGPAWLIRIAVVANHSIIVVSLRRQPIRLFPRCDPTETDAFHPRTSEEHTAELQSIMRIPYSVLFLKKK